MRLTLCLEGNTEGRVLASVDMEEIMKHCNANTNLKDTIKDIHDNVAQEMYCKGIDEFATKICEILEKYQTGFNMVSMANIWLCSKELAEELKAGVK